MGDSRVQAGGGVEKGEAAVEKDTGKEGSVGGGEEEIGAKKAAAPVGADARKEEGSGSDRKEGWDDGDGEFQGPMPELEDCFEGLNLHGEEEVDLDFSEELDELIKEVHWLGVFRVHTSRPFSHAALLNSMRNAWSASQGITFSVKGPNLFLFQCHCLRDWRRVMEGGPWVFRDAPVVIVEYDGFTNVTDYNLNMIPVWARIKGIPAGLTRKKELAEKVAAKVGEPPFTVIVDEGRINTTSCLRARVFLDVNKPLVRFVPITLRERKKYPVLYEKLPEFCYFCGLMGHVVEECGDGVHAAEECEWGDWLLWEGAPVNARPYGSRGDGGSGLPASSSAMTRITAPELSPSPPDSPPPVRRSPAPATPPSRRRSSPPPSLALTPSSASTSATSSRPRPRPSPKRTYSPAQWVPVSSHSAFALRGGVGGGGAAWDAAGSRLYVWDPSSRGAHRVSVRIRDAEAEKDGEEVAVEAAVPSEMLMPETDLGYEVTHISLNTDGSSLLLAGSHNINVLYVHERVSEDGDTIICRTAPVASQILPSNNDGIKVLQTSWHPFSSSHFGVLTSDAVFRLFDLSFDLEQPEQEFYLQPILPGRCQNASSICPVAFSYGSDHLWDRFSVFILFSDGSIFVLCPVVPFGCDYSKRHIEEIYEDVNTFGLKSSNPNVVTNSHLAIAWLEATFPELLRQSADSSTLMSRARAYAPVDDSLTLQGPLCRVCEENNELEGKSSSCEGKAVGFVYSSVGKDSVLVTAWGSGQLQIDALADEIQPQWSIGVPTRLNVDSHGRIKSVAMICDSNPQDSWALRSHRSSMGSNVKSNTEAVWMGHSPPLLRLSIVDLALPKTSSSSSLSLFLDPLVPERFYCAHGGGLDMVTLHFLPFSYPEMASTPPSVHPVLTTGNSDTSSPFLSGFVAIADAYGHVQLVGITYTGECFVVEMKGWKEPTPLQLDICSKDIKDVESSTTGMISKELLAGPDPPILPTSTSLRSLTPDSIEGKSTLHHYIKVFHEHYVEYGHKVFIELKEHADYVTTEIEDKQKRLQAVKQSLLSIEAKDEEINRRVERASKVYDLLEKHIESFKMLPAANKKPLSQAELEFKSQLDRFADVELDALRTSIAALSARMKRFTHPVLGGGSAGTGVAPWQAPKAGRGHVSESQMSLMKSSLERLSLLNEENNQKLRLIETELKNKEQ